MSVAEQLREIEDEHGDVAEPAGVIDEVYGLGLPPRHIDQATAELDRLARTWLDLQQTRKALAQRELPDAIVGEFDRLEKKVSALLTRTLRHHPVWPWLSQFPGLGGAHVALIIGRIGDPRRFPGQQCSEGHYFPPIFSVGAACPVTDHRDGSDHRDGAGADEAGTDERLSERDTAAVCPGVMLPPRETTGVRSLWHWAGLGVTPDGRAPRKRKGVQSDWEPRVRASFMQPGGIGEQIVRLNVPYYNDIYRAAKARLILRATDHISENGNCRGGANQLRAADSGAESETTTGRPPRSATDPRCESELEPGGVNGRAADRAPENDIRNGRPLRQHEADRIARKIAAKAFAGDLLTHWKTLT